MTAYLMNQQKGSLPRLSNESDVAYYNGAHCIIQGILWCGHIMIVLHEVRMIPDCSERVSMYETFVRFVSAIRALTALMQARSELRFWRGAEVDKVQNLKQLYVINLAKVRKIVSF